MSLSGQQWDADVSSTDDSVQATQSEQLWADGVKPERMLPSVTTDTEQWSTAVETLHEKDSPSHGTSPSTAKETMEGPASLPS